MNIKSLLLGSAAALVAVTGARAADAVVIAEPEPVEYVRVCDTYGTGFYYIPGTEICIKIGGYVRYDIGAGDLFGEVSDTGDDTYYKRGRFALRVDARTETELGTLQGRAQVNFDWTTGTSASLRFRDRRRRWHCRCRRPVRKCRRLRRSLQHGHGTRLGQARRLPDRCRRLVLHDLDRLCVRRRQRRSDLLRPLHHAHHPVRLGWRHGFSVGAAVEEGSDTGYGTIIQDYAPHAAAGAKWAGGVFGVSAVLGYDSVQDEFSAKGRVDITVSDTFSFFVMGAWTDDEGDDLVFSGGNYYAQWGGEYAFWAGTAIKFSDRTTFNAEFGYNELGDYSLVADVNITVVPGFVVTPGVGWKHTDDGDDFDFDDDDDSLAATSVPSSRSNRLIL